MVTVATFASCVICLVESPVITSSLRKVGDRKPSNKLQPEAGVFESLYPLDKKEDLKLKPIIYHSTFQAVDEAIADENELPEEAGDQVAQIDTQEVFKSEDGKRFKLVTTKYLNKHGALLYKKSSKHLL